ncbi:unnamed protein product [Adineta ricciae]|uniref:Uncharacterized protein n=1 Tax=Adineta ricciae TaxID=249248 RepID=A0A815DY23_ADIRI|nr:unnamed protein product [Adineta ricciae]CAF1675417.1 unnamed protein product [Adineta ricciae]
MLTDSIAPSLWFSEDGNDSSYPHRSSYKGKILIDGHLKKNWNTCWTKIVAVNEIVLGLLILILGILMIVFHLALSSTAHGIWTGALTFLAGFFAFFTIIYRHHRYFLLTACIHIVSGLASTILIFISVFALVLEMKNENSSIFINNNNNNQQLNYGLHVTLILLGLYEKLLCYTFLIMIIRHTHKMV